MPLRLRSDIRLMGHSSYGEVSFLISSDTYRYRHIDGPAMNEVLRLNRNPGKALNIAKKYADEYKKNKEEWKPI